MLGYLGKVLFFMILSSPVAIALRLLGYPDWSVMLAWAGVGVIGRETLGRKIDHMNRRDGLL